MAFDLPKTIFGCPVVVDDSLPSTALKGISFGTLSDFIRYEPIGYLPDDEEIPYVGCIVHSDRYVVTAVNLETRQITVKPVDEE